jgi:NAD(P)-dependent dehydrogenase (short-subunit alcohol dehydrogenase family)
VIADLEQARPEAAAAEIAADTHGQLLGLITDVTDEDPVEKAVARTIREYGGVDILCSNTGNQIIGGVHEC